MPSLASDFPEPTTGGAAPAGSAVRDGKFEFRVVDVSRAATVSDPTGNPYMTVNAQGEFIVVTLTVTNIGNEPQSYFGQNQKLIDASGREYGANTEADMYMNDVAFGDINPGNSIQVRVAGAMYSSRPRLSGVGGRVLADAADRDVTEGNQEWQIRTHL
jgi:Domain of unknown function (DUF4352)